MNKNIAITGATGLLGSNLANAYINEGWNVYALIKDENSKSFLSPKVNKVFGNMANEKDIEYFIQKSTPSYFFHLAAQTQAYDSLKYPYQTFYNNMVGTLNVLEGLREFGASKAIVVASSDKAYGELQTSEYTESHPLNGIYPYDASKSCTDLISNSYRMTYGLPIITTRACNIYGEGDFNSQRIIPAISLAIRNNVKISIRNGGADFREYIHVQDVVSAYKKIVDLIISGNSLSSVNISSGDRYTTLMLLKLIEEKTGSTVPFQLENSSGFEIRKQFMDSSLLSNLTDWNPHRNLETEISKVVHWCMKNLEI